MSTHTKTYQMFLTQLRTQPEFRGEIATDLASRLLMSTDNSIYQVLPEAVIYPKTVTDIQVMLQLASEERFLAVQFSPRGGGTGTNGQSLTSSIMVDCSKYMHHILEINTQERWARVQPGVVLDQLNAELKPSGLFFAPSLSPSNRATLGGMFNTDACGKGSCCYGRTSDHVFEVGCVFSDGTGWQSLDVDLSRLQELKALPGKVGDVYRVVDQVIQDNRDEIGTRFPDLARHTTGYNLPKVYNEQKNHFRLNYLLAGSEGTLAFITELKLKLTPIPKVQHLFAIAYPSFEQALRAAQVLKSVEPTAIETVDDNILDVAKSDEIFQRVAFLLAPNGEAVTLDAVNLVEFTGNSEAEIADKIVQLRAQLGQEQVAGRVVRFIDTCQPEDIAALWDLRKKSVGLLANLPGDRQPVPFVEDTMVPPEKLADYVSEFREVLDQYGLKYGMFGHVDAGCLHVRPALNMLQPDDAKLVPEITAKVAALVKKYGGVLWGEHGRGFRSSLGPDVLGEKLYYAMRQIKTAFDPANKLNPGKLFSPLASEQKLVQLEGPLKGERDRQIAVDLQQMFKPALRCNGNGQCFDYQFDSVMCPSYLVTRDRRHSPKGRATVFREFLRQLSIKGEKLDVKPQKMWRQLLRRVGAVEPAVDQGAFTQQVFDVMQGCLGCKACASSCPVKVNIPHLKAIFLAHFYQHRARPWRDFFVANLERAFMALAYMPESAKKWANAQWIARRAEQVGLVDLPEVASKSALDWLKRHGALPAKKLSSGENSVCFVLDVFTCFIEPQVVVATCKLLQKLGFKVGYVLLANGKPLHVLGFLSDFQRLARKNQTLLKPLIERNIPLVGLDGSTTLVYRDEYRDVLGEALPIQLLGEWLASDTILGRLQSHIVGEGQAAHFYPHCSEKALAMEAGVNSWLKLFKALNFNVQAIQTGCCGMAGLYGHEHEHAQQSKTLYQMSWAPKIEKASRNCPALVSGFSCRCQIKRCHDKKMFAMHPVAFLLRGVSL